MRTSQLIIVGGLLLVFVGGCAQSPLVLQGKVQSLEQQQTSLASKNDELQTRANSLDRNNQELETLLAQERQQKRILEDQVGALRDQLGTTSSQLAKVQSEAQNFTQKAQTLEASLKRQTGATIRANNSLRASMPVIRIQGVEVREDGDVVRIELPGSRLFEPGSARLTSEGLRLIDDVGAQIARTYPEQIIGVEGHTSSDPVPAGRWASQHQLSTGMAMAVYDQMMAKGSFGPSRLFIVGHGANHPAASNATQPGRERNLRVELVVYPDKPVGR
ncbi:MAG: OmpA family protein [Planctomycetales bacterium]|nr:OmpA family protein [Planctomycetales bacterium]MBN8625344.1 OmpA family protein [Planctomycetota bacterium]